jgi:hypothetical protein
VLVAGKICREVTGRDHEQRERAVVAAERELAVRDAPIRTCECPRCGSTIGLLMTDEARPVCLACAEVEQLVFLASVDGLT